MINSIFPVDISICRFKNENKNFVYDSCSGMITEISDLLYDILGLVSKRNYCEIVEALKNKYNEVEIKRKVEILEKNIKLGFFSLKYNKHLKNNEKSLEKHFKFNGITNFWLSLSHCCNLSCIYCFANGGSYGGKELLMTKEIAKKAIDIWVSQLNENIKKVTVNFFGGEPLLNKDVFLFSSEYINAILKNINIDVKYIITTNGTIIDEDILETMSMYNFDVNISIDGSQEIHDKNRCFKSGEGSFNIIRENLEKFKEYKINFGARLTVTHNSILNLKREVQKLWEMGFPFVYYEFVDTNDKNIQIKKEDLDEFRKQLREIVDINYNNIVLGKKNLLINVIKISKELHKNKVRYGCAAFRGEQVIVNPNGEIFICHAFMDNKKYIIGTVDNGIDLDILLKEKEKCICPKACEACWARKICKGGCLKNNFADENTLSYIGKLKCEEKKILMEESLKFYTNIYINNLDLIEKIYN